jgi:hypothetical protein
VIAITAGAVGMLLLGVWAAYQFHFKPLPPAPATPSVKPAPVVEVAPRPAAPSPSKADLAEIERQRNADEFVAKVAAIPRRPEPEPDSIPGNAVPRQRFYDDVLRQTADEVLKFYGKPVSVGPVGGNHEPKATARDDGGPIHQDRLSRDGVWDGGRPFALKLLLWTLPSVELHVLKGN